MLLGDAFYPPPFHLRAPDDTLDYAMVKQFLSERHSYYVDAHSPLRTLSAALMGQ
jgi:hypothetical protein